MGVGKKSSTGSQAVEVGGKALLVPSHATDPVVEVVHGDKENIGQWICRRCRRKGEGGEKTEEDSGESWKW